MDPSLRWDDGLLIFLFCFLFPALSSAQTIDHAVLQEQLVQAAADIRAVERQLNNAQETLATLETKRAGLEKEYMARRAKMADTLGALTRMSRTPREAVLIRPGGPLQAARTSMLLSASVPVIESEAASYRNLLTDLERTRVQLTEKSAETKAARVNLKMRHARLSTLMEQRDTPITEAEAQEIMTLAHAARNLRDLMGALDTSPAGLPAPTFDEGDGQLPVSGVVRVRYGQTDALGAKSSGLSIETLPGSLVVAPLGGIVRYAGAFKGYGNIVIIAHKGGYHSLIAGLDKISVSAGQTIVSGEPIAILDASGISNQDIPPARRTVYYELRQGGSPVNPSRKLPDLG
jgi:septal ring factor EnvC (AmiA/AmiB activator)